MFFGKRNPIIFAGASANHQYFKQNRSHELKEPIKHGDLHKVMRTTPEETPVIVADGVFGSTDAISIRECQEFLESGRILVGCSSIGALRANELSSEGMIGVGQIYSGFKTGFFRSDADVAVVVNPKNFEEMTISMVFFRSAIDWIERNNKVDENMTAQVVRKIEGLHYTKRTVKNILREIIDLKTWNKEQLADLYSLLIDKKNNPKVRDLVQAASLFSKRKWPLELSIDKRKEIFLPSCSGCGAVKIEDDIFCGECANISHEQ